MIWEQEYNFFQNYQLAENEEINMIDYLFLL